MTLDRDIPGGRPGCGPWAAHAACLDKPADWFFPESPTYVTPEARALCEGCHVQPQCLEHAVRTGEPHGIWGGKSEAQIARIRRSIRLGAA
jgi:WhiB family redox-sensing transcriptional regulator